MIINYQSILILYWEGTHNERKNNLLRDLVDSVKVPSEIVKKTLEPSVHQIGEGFGNIFYLVFAPILKAKIRKDIEIQKYKEEIEAEILKIPPEKRIEPPLSIVGPALEASKYYIDHDVIRSMFSKLVASSMNIDFTNRAHASFIEIIKQLSPLDAVNFKFLVENRGGIGVGNIRIEDTTPPNGGIDWVRNFIPFPELTIEKLDVYIASVDNCHRRTIIDPSAPE